MENVKIKGRIGTWYEIDRHGQYILFESELFGDESIAIVGIEQNGEIVEVGETYDGLLLWEFDNNL